MGTERPAHNYRLNRPDNPTVVAYMKLPVWLLVFIVFRAASLKNYFISGMPSSALNR